MENLNHSIIPVILETTPQAVFVSPSSRSWGSLRKVKSLGPHDADECSLFYPVLSNFKHHGLDNDNEVILFVSEGE